MCDEQTINASEAIYGFSAWLTSRKEPITLSSANDATAIVPLIQEWLKANNLPQPRESVYPNNIKQPR